MDSTGANEEWRENGRLKAKCFSVDILGYEEAKKQAAEYRGKKIAELNDNGAGYTERHGK